jgi:hypothetical protein
VSLDGDRHGDRLVNHLPITWLRPTSGPAETALRRSTPRTSPHAQRSNWTRCADEVTCLVIPRTYRPPGLAQRNIQTSRLRDCTADG